MIKIYVDHILEDGKRGSLTMINIKKKKVSHLTFISFSSYFGRGKGWQQ